MAAKQSRTIEILALWFCLFAGPLPAIAADGPITQYCHHVELLLQRDPKLVSDLSEGTNVDFLVTPGGEIETVQRSQVALGSETAQTVGKRIIENLKRIEAPPYAAPNPLWLTAKLSNQVKAIQVTWRDCDLGSYVRNVHLRVKHGWAPPENGPAARVILSFRISRDGNVSNLRIAQPSGVPELDRSALVAARNACPFEPMPDGSPPGVDINFTMDYNMHRHHVGQKVDH